MLYDLFFELGGDALVRLIEQFLAPLFSFVCNMSEAFGNDGFWNIFAELLERILS